MVNALDRAMGIVERTSAEVGEGRWLPGMRTQNGFLWAGLVKGEKCIAFESFPGQVLFALTADNLISARKVTAALNIIVEVVVGSEDGTGDVAMVVIGPRGRVKRIFAYLGHNL